MYEKVLYAAVGAPVITAKKAQERLEALRARLNKDMKSFRKDARTRVDTWASEGEKLVNRITDAKVVDEIASRVDFEQVSVQVSKLRDQLEDMLSTWRASFRPVEKQAVKVAETAAETITSGAPKAPAKKAPAKKAPAKKAPAKRPSAKGATARKPAARKPVAASA